MAPQAGLQRQLTPRSHTCVCDAGVAHERFGDISAVCAFKRTRYLPTLLDRVELHSRLVFGSDYPVVSVGSWGGVAVAVCVCVRGRVCVWPGHQCT